MTSKIPSMPAFGPQGLPPGFGPGHRAIREEHERRIRMNAYLALAAVAGELDAAGLEKEGEATRSVMELLWRGLTGTEEKK